MYIHDIHGVIILKDEFSSATHTRKLTTIKMNFHHLINITLRSLNA